MTSGSRRAVSEAILPDGEIATFAVAEEPAGWFITAPQRLGPFPSRAAVVEAAENLAAWVRADGKEAQVIYAPRS
jgi:hypothetical protein